MRVGKDARLQVEQSVSSLLQRLDQLPGSGSGGTADKDSINMPHGKTHQAHVTRSCHTCSTECQIQRLSHAHCAYMRSFQLFP